MQSLRRCTRNLLSNSRLTRLNSKTTPTSMIRTRNHCTINTNHHTFLSTYFDQIRDNGQETAYIFDNNHVSYSEFHQSTLKCALYLKEKYNIKQGDVISCISKNIPQTQNVMMACHMLNAVFFPINGNLPKATIDYYTDKVNSKLIITDDKSLSSDNDNVIHISPSSSCIGHEFMANTNLSSMEHEMEDIINKNEYNSDNHSVLMQTSGSTALPKIVVHTNESCNGWINNGLNPMFKSTALLTSQSYHVSSYIQLMCSLANGGCIVYPSKIMLDPNSSQKDKCMEMIRLAELYQIQVVTLIVTPVYELVKLGQKFGNSVKAIPFGGDIIPAGLLQEFMKLHSENEVPPVMLNAYGSTEVGLIGMSDPLPCTQENCNDLDKIKYELTHIKKHPPVIHKIDEITGELYVKTDSMLKEYYDDPIKTAEAFTDDGFFKTGDTIHILDDTATNDTNDTDEDVFKFKVVSRNKQVIVAENGRYIYPQYIEDELLQHEMINGAVVIGVDCRLLYGDNCCDESNAYKYPVAFVRTNKELYNDKERDELIEELMILCQDRNENEVPYKIFLVDDIPRAHIGKVDRNKLEKFAIEYFEFINSKNKLENNEYTFALYNYAEDLKIQLSD